MTPEERDRHRKGPITLRGSHRPTRTTDQRLLEEDGAGDWVHSDPWRVLRIQAEFVEGFGALAAIGHAISVFGSARIGPESPEYDTASQVARPIAPSGHAGLTGGRLGIMWGGDRVA